ncbi:MAG: ATPase [Mucilaginibacter sp.]|nr:ATPase [Mucilaginibacter sp.]
MSASASKGASTRVSGITNVPRNAVYGAFVDRDITVRWMHPDNRSAHVHVFEPYEGGKFTISLTYHNGNMILPANPSGTWTPIMAGSQN